MPIFLANSAVVSFLFDLSVKTLYLFIVTTVLAYGLVSVLSWKIKVGGVNTLGFKPFLYKGRVISSEDEVTKIRQRIMDSKEAPRTKKKHLEQLEGAERLQQGLTYHKPPQLEDRRLSQDLSDRLRTQFDQVYDQNELVKAAHGDGH